MLPSEAKLKKLKELINAVSDSLTKTDFLKAFEQVTHFVSEVEKRLSSKIDVFLNDAVSSFKSSYESILNVQKGDLIALRDEWVGTFSKLLKDHQDSMNFLRDKARSIKDGKDGKPGKDGSPDKPTQIRDKLELLRGEERLDASAVKNLPKFVQDTGTKAGWGAHPIKVLDDGTVIDKNARTINFTGGTVTRSSNGTINVPVGGGGTPGGSDTQVQFNDGGSFGGADLLYTEPTATTRMVETAGVASGDGTDIIFKAGDTDDNSAHGGTAWLKSGGITIGPVKTISTVSTGSAYSENDVVTLVGGNNNATIRLTDVSGGIFDSAAIVNAGTGYTNGTYSVTGGTGSGAQFQITTVGSTGSYVFVSQFDDIDIFGGDSVNPSFHGSGLSMIGGNGFGSTPGGAITFTGGAGGATGLGGEIAFTAGNGGATSGNGASVSLTAGSAQGGDSNGGSLSFAAGAKTGAGVAGKLNFKDGASAQNAILDTSVIATADKTFTFNDSSGGFVVADGNTTSSAPGTTATPVFTSYYGGNTKALGDPVAWIAINIAGTTYKLPLYT